MGRKVAEAVLNKNSLRIVGALDIDDQIAGKDLGEILEIPNKYKVVALMPLGYPGEEPSARPRKSFEEIVCFDTFQE